jgi:hypothetical protein
MISHSYKASVILSIKEATEMADKCKKAKPEASAQTTEKKATPKTEPKKEKK